MFYVFKCDKCGKEGRRITEDDHPYSISYPCPEQNCDGIMKWRIGDIESVKKRYAILGFFWHIKRDTYPFRGVLIIDGQGNFSGKTKDDFGETEIKGCVSKEASFTINLGPI